MFGDEPSPDEVIKHFIGRPSANIEMDTVLPRHLSTNHHEIISMAGRLRE